MTNKSIGEDNGGFTSWSAYWNYERSILSEFRYIRTQNTESFLRAVLATSERRRLTLPAGSIFWRAQLGHCWRTVGGEREEHDIECPFPRDRMKPQLGRASDGRANARGIPCLYLATTKETAISEVRPWVGSYVSAGQFKILNEVAVVDCTRAHNEIPIFLEEPTPDEKIDAVWTYIDRAFAEPMTRADDQAGYAPTQIISELFKNAGFGGLVYKSNFGEKGFNIALFNLDAASLINCSLFRIETIELKISDANDTYYVKNRS